MKFNTAISKLMEYINNFSSKKEVHRDIKETLVQLLSPIAPHLSEELWFALGHRDSIFNEKWPSFDKDFISDDVITIVIQVNGKVRGKIEVGNKLSKEAVVLFAKSNKNVETYLADKTIIKEVYVPGRLINFVVK